MAAGERDKRALRASDQDRDKVAEVLRAAAADGRLTLAVRVVGKAIFGGVAVQRKPAE